MKQQSRNPKILNWEKKTYQLQNVNRKVRSDKA